jgi:hypothetical protein
MNEDLAELKGLVSAIKADHQAQKEKERREAWTKYVSLSIIWLAVLAAFANMRGGGYSSATMKQLNLATYNQALASDQWAYYQAKGIKQAIAEQERDRFVSSGSADDVKRLAALDAKVKKYDDDKNQISNDARALEVKRDEAARLSDHSAEQGRGMGWAISLFQIAIGVGGMCLVVKKRWLWALSLSTGVFAAGQMFWVIWRG